MLINKYIFYFFISKPVSFSSISYNKMGRELLTADELAVMKNDDCIVFIRGIKPFFTKKYMCKDHPNFKFSGDSDKSNVYVIADHYKTPKYHDMDESSEMDSFEISINNIPSATLKREDIEKSNEIRTESSQGLKTYNQEVVSLDTIKELGAKKASEIPDIVELEESYNPDDDFEMDLDLEDEFL